MHDHIPLECRCNMQSCQYLKNPGIKSEMDVFVMAEQNKILNTCNFYRNIIKNSADWICIPCEQYIETIDSLHRLFNLVKRGIQNIDLIRLYIQLNICPYYSAQHIDK